MPALKKLKHEQFVQAIVAGQTAGQAYVAAYGSAKGADQSASRLLKNAQISARIAELEAGIRSKLLADTILTRESRLKALENRWKLLQQVLMERGETLGQLTIHGYPMGSKDAQESAQEDAEQSEMPAPGASTGLVSLDWKGRDATRAVWRVDTQTLAELRAIEEQAARELGQWMDKSEVTHKDGDLAARLAAGRQRVAKAKGCA